VTAPNKDQPLRRVHLAGADVIVEGRWMRQLCQWCGYRLIDEDLTRVAVPSGQSGALPHFEIGAWICVEGVNPTAFSVVDAPGEDKYPAGACFDDVVPALSMVSAE